MDIEVHIERTEKRLKDYNYVLSVYDVRIRKLQSPQDSRIEISANIQFWSGSLLHFCEIVETGSCYPQVLKYSYHYLQDNLQLFRYDNNPHHRDIPTFPHHKHIWSANNETIEAADPPNTDKLFEEISQIIESKKFIQ